MKSTPLYPINIIKIKITNKKKFSTFSISIVDNIFEHLDNCDSDVGICIDLQKVFDTVNHRILLKKLDRCGIRGIMFDWIQDYLSNRQQYVFLQNILFFSTGSYMWGPHGFILGPLLFLIYVNDIGNGLPFKTVKLYADDTNLFIFNKYVVTLSITANEHLFSLSLWFIANRLSLNLHKTCFVTFGTHQEHDFDIRIGNIEIINVDHCRYLFEMD